MLGGPAFLGPRAVIISPDDLVLERFSPEDQIEEHFAVMHLAIVDVEEQAAVVLQHTMRFPQPRLNESQIVIEDVAVLPRAELHRPVAHTLEPSSVPIAVTDHGV